MNLDPVAPSIPPEPTDDRCLGSVPRGQYAGRCQKKARSGKLTCAIHDSQELELAARNVATHRDYESTSDASLSSAIRQLDAALASQQAASAASVAPTREFLSNWPERRFPDDGFGDEDAYNAGWNECRLACHAALASIQQAGSAASRETVAYEHDGGNSKKVSYSNEAPEGFNFGTRELVYKTEADMGAASAASVAPTEPKCELFAHCSAPTICAINGCQFKDRASIQQAGSAAPAPAAETVTEYLRRMDHAPRTKAAPATETMPDLLSAALLMIERPEHGRVEMDSGERIDRTELAKRIRAALETARRAQENSNAR